MATTAEEIRAVVYEILTMQGDDGRAYGIIMADLNTALMFLDDPAIRATLSDDPDLDLEDFVGGARDNDLFFIVPPELMGVWSPFIRLVMSSLMIIKRRNPQSKQINFYIDEAGQLKTADFLALAMTFGRGAGIKTISVFQDIGQIEKNFGREGLTTFIGSAQVRQLIGTRDPMTARILSEMLGNATIEYVDEVRKERAMQSARKAVFSAMMSGDDPFSAMLEARQLRAQTEVGERMARPLASLDEILNMGEGEQLLFISGVNCPAIKAQRRPYWQLREAAGHFMPNPYHPPMDRVQVMGRFGMQTRRVICEGAPDHIAALPQHRRTGTWRYIEGFRPI